GTGSPLDYGNLTVSTSGTYTVRATTGGGCPLNMAGSAFVFTYPLPNIYTLSAGSTSYCAGSTSPAHLTLSSSDAGVSYELFKGGVSTGTILSGSGFLLDFGAISSIGPGTYS